MTTENFTVCPDMSIRYITVTDSTLGARYRQGEIMMIDLAKRPIVGDDVIAQAAEGKIVGCVVAINDTDVTLQKYDAEGTAITLPVDSDIKIIAGMIPARAWERLQATA